LDQTVEDCLGMILHSSQILVLSFYACGALLFFNS